MSATVALLHQYQRVETPNDGSVIRATRQDYEIARYLLADPMARALAGGVSEAAMRFYTRLHGRVSPPFTTEDAVRGETVIGDVQTVRAYVRTLRDYGYLVVETAAKGNKPATYCFAPNPPDHETLCGLPAPDELFGKDGRECTPRLRVNV